MNSESPSVSNFETTQTPRPGSARRSSLEHRVTQAEYRAALRSSRRWAWSAYGVTSIAIMLLLFSAFIVYFEPIHDASMAFRDPAKNLRDDGMYGALIGIVFGVTIVLPSALLPLLLYVLIDRRIGLTCTHCGASLTSFRRGEHLLQNGTCAKCCAPVYLQERDARSVAPETAD